MLQTFQKLLANQDAILEVMRNPDARDYIDEDLCTICFNSFFWKELVDLTALLTPLSDTLTILDGSL
jgi:hypothetical protein